ncbi:MAG: hypothetical protein ACLPM3_03205, partial [Terracidiphilus sp.]
MEIGMRKLSIAFLLLFPLSIIATGQDAPIKPQMSLAYVLDPAQQTVTAVDIASGRTTASVSVNGKITSSENLAERANNQFFSGVDTLLLTHDGSRLLRLRTGELKFTVRFGYHPQE